MSNKYKIVNQLLMLIDEPNQTACINIFNDNKVLFKTVQGSSNNHQAWVGGYYDHVQEAMNIAVILYNELNSLRALPFSLSDLLLIVYLHDIEKPWKYNLINGELVYRDDMLTKADHQGFRMLKLKEYGVELTPDQLNGLEYAEGEISNYSNTKRHMGPLAAVVHMCDIASARLWFDYPLVSDDSWKGASRTL